MLDGIVLQTVNDDENEVLLKSSQVLARSKQRSVSSGTRTVLHRMSLLLLARERGMLKKGALSGCGTFIHVSQVLPTKIETF